MNDIRDKLGKIVFAIVILGVAAYAMFGGKADAAELGPNPPTAFWYGAVGLTAIDNKTDPTATIGYRHSLSMADGVVEASTQGTVSLMAARSVGDVRVLGGVNSTSGSNDLGLSFGAEYKNFMARVNTYNKALMVAGKCKRPPTTTNKGYSSFTISYVKQLGSK